MTHSKRQHLTLFLATLAVLVATLTPSTSRSEGTIGLHGGYRFIDEQGFIGVHGRYTFAQISRLKVTLYPNLDLHVFDDEVMIIAFDLDVLLAVDLRAFFEPYGGTGLGITYFNTDPGEETLSDLNLIGGVNFRFGIPLEPFAEVEWGMFETDTVSLTVGIGFVFGGGSGEEEESPEMID